MLNLHLRPNNGGLKAAVIGLLLIGLTTPATHAQPRVIDLANWTAETTFLSRIYGSVGNGSRGLPVAGGSDVDGDGNPDVAFASMLASPMQRDRAGQVFLRFEVGALGSQIDSSERQSSVLEILGVQPSEHFGSEIWMDDVTGDGLAELLICRQDFSPSAGRSGAGALTILRGGPELRSQAESLNALDVENPPLALGITTLYGVDRQDRFCMWVRTGDVDDDGVLDFVVGADQSGPGSEHAGRAYVVRGGSHLFDSTVHDLADLGSVGFSLAGQVAVLNPTAVANEHHFGATCQIADLDGNGRAEVLIASALNRAGGGLGPNDATEPVHGSGGTPNGTLHVFWDNNFPDTPWPDDLQINVEGPAGDLSTIRGLPANRAFGEEILGGLDYDNDGSADLFVGDLTGTAPGRALAGLGHIIYDVAAVRNQNFDLATPPPGIRTSLIYGPIAGAIGADTGMHGDFDGDGIDDLAFSSPHDRPFGRTNAGTLHVLFGRVGGWPELIDLAPGAQPSTDEVRIVEINGARGAAAGDAGDTLAYSGAAGDIDLDGRVDIITNEMVGNGIAPDTVDVGNLIVISGAALADALFDDGFE